MSGRGVPWEVPAVWTVLGAVAVEVLVTYSRLPAYHLYHVSGSGLGAGAGRALVYLNFPVSLVALAIVAVVPGRRALRLAAAALCAVTFWPGVVSQANLDARPINALPAVGVALALAASRGPPLRGGARAGGDRVRLVAAAVLVVAAIPWAAADLGTSILSSQKLWTSFGDPELTPRLHTGHHHGMDGTLLALAALALSRPLPQIERRGLRVATGLYLGLMLAYGLGNELQDFWGEQLVKRGLLSRMLPNILEPAATVAWGIVLVAALVFGALFVRSAGRPAAGVRPMRAGRRFRRGAVAGTAVALAAVLVTAVHGGVSSTGAKTPVPSRREAAALAREGTIVFSMPGDRDRDLYRVRFDGSAPEPLLRQSGSDANPAWSPDARIVFQSDRKGGTELWLTTAGGELSRRLTDSGGASGEPAWSRDGTRVAFASTRAGDADLYILMWGSGRIVRLTRGSSDDEWPSWSPDGRRLVFERDGDLFTIGAGGRGLRRLTSGTAVDRLPAWSPEGRRIAFASARGGNEDLYVVRSTGAGPPRRLTDDPAEDTAPAWSPDGRYLAFLSRRDGRDQLYVMDAAGGNVRRLTGERRDKGRPAWGG
jgi:Tol biopolymer transport system component